MKNAVTLAAKNSTLHAAARWPRLVVSGGSLEALKWLGLVLMTVDHVNKYLLNGTNELLFVAGRPAMPIFVFVLAYNLARPGALEQGVYLRTMKRLGVFGMLSLPAFLALGGPAAAWQPLNILFTLLVFTVTIYLIDLRTIGGFIPAMVVFVGAGALVEFGWSAIALGIGVWSYCKRPGWSPVALVVVALGSLWFINGNFWAFAAVPLFIAASRFDAPVPRLRWVFYICYPAHLFILGLIRIPMSKAGYIFFSTAIIIGGFVAPAGEARAQTGDALPPMSATVSVVFPDGVSVFKPNDDEVARLADARSAALITIRGRTGAVAPSLKDENVALARALAARAWLINRGVSPLKIVINYASAADYAADNSTPDGKRENQRVEIELVYVTAPIPISQAQAVLPVVVKARAPAPAVAAVALPEAVPETPEKKLVPVVPDTAAAWRDRANAALTEYKKASEAELLALMREQQRLETSTREAEARLQQLRAATAEATAALEKRNNEPSPSLYIARNWTLTDSDKTLRGVLTRWSKAEYVDLTWTASVDYPLLGGSSLHGDLPLALQSVMGGLLQQDGLKDGLSYRLDSAGKRLVVSDAPAPKPKQK